MSRIRIIIDGDTVMDADPGTWTHTPPDLDALKLQSTTPPQPWMQSVMFALADIATKAFAGQTQTDSKGGWTLDVEGTTITVTTRT